MQQALEQHGSLVGGLYRLSGHFQQRVELDGVDADAVFLDGRGMAHFRTLVAAFRTIPGLGGRLGGGSGRRGGHGDRRSRDGGGRSGSDLAAGRHDGVIHAFPVQAIGAGGGNDGGGRRHDHLGNHHGDFRHHGGGRRVCVHALAFDGVRQDVFQLFRHGRQAFRRGTVGQFRQLVGDETGRLQRRLDGDRGHRRGARAQGVEQIFRQMAGRHQCGQAHEAGATLDGVEGTKHGIQCFLVVRITLEAQ